MIGIVEKNQLSEFRKVLSDEEFEEYHVAAKLQHGFGHIVHVFVKLFLEEKYKINGI